MNHPTENQRPGHSIRLRGPCNLVWTRNGTQLKAVRVQIPGKIEINSFEARKIEPGDTFTLKRTFHKPTGLDKAQRVTLELSGFEGAARLMINRESGHQLDLLFEDGSISEDITRLLGDVNKFEVEFESLPAYAGDVRLVICE